MVAPGAVEAAQYAANRNGGSRELRDAWLAWWAGEESIARWPTNSRCNPGNIRPGLESSKAVGVDGRNFLVFPNPKVGVDAMIDLVERGSMYGGIRAAIAAIAAGTARGEALADAVGRSPWGTNAPTIRTALAYVRRTVGATPTGTGWATAKLNTGPGVDGGGGGGGGSSSRTEADYYARIASIGIPTDPAHVITMAEAERMATELYQVDPRLIASSLAGRTNRELAAAYASGTELGTGPLDSLARAVGGIPAALGDVFRSVALLVAILVLVILGLYGLTRADSEG